MKLSLSLSLTSWLDSLDWIFGSSDHRELLTSCIISPIFCSFWKKLTDKKNYKERFTFRLGNVKRYYSMTHLKKKKNSTDYIGPNNQGIPLKSFNWYHIFPIKHATRVLHSCRTVGLQLQNWEECPIVLHSSS